MVLGLFAALAKFLQFQAIFEYFLVFAGKIVNPLAFGTLQLNHVILRHIVYFIR